MKKNGISETQKLRQYEKPFLPFCPWLHGLGISNKTMGQDLGYELLNESTGQEYIHTEYIACQQNLRGEEDREYYTRDAGEKTFYLEEWVRSFIAAGCDGYSIVL